MGSGTSLKDKMVHRNNRRRGLATVVTGAILLSAVAALGSGLVSWTNSNLFTHKQALQSSYSTSINKINEFLIIENVWFGGNSPQKFVNITMTNVGNVGLNVTEIELTNSAGIIKYQFSNGGILPGKSYSPPLSYDWVDNQLVDITIITSRDSIYKTQALP